MKKLLTILMVVVLLFTATACSKSGGDSNTTEISVSIRTSGFGQEYFYPVVEDFQVAYAEKSYADGKTGVKIVDSPTNSPNDAYITEAATSAYDIVFSSLLPTYQSVIWTDQLLDLDEIVKDDTREGGSIDSVIFDNVKGMCIDEQGHYRILPVIESYMSVLYNADVFTKRNAYLADETCDASCYDEFVSKYGPGNGYVVNFVNSEKIGQTGCVLSKGPDGELNTSDDGLPASLEEFLVLLDYLKNDQGIAPIGAAGAYGEYWNYFVEALWSSLAGNAQMNSYFQLNGKMQVVKTDSAGNFLYENEPLFEGIDYVKKPQTEWVDITPANANLGNSMVAKYYAFALTEIIRREGFVSEQVDNSKTTHTDAQRYLMYSSSDAAMAATGSKEVAMIATGSYWVNESTLASNFTNYAFYSKSDKLPDVRMMALPTTATSAEREASDFVAEPSNMFMEEGMCVAVNGKVRDNPEVLEACKDFIRFFFEETQLRKATEKSSQFMPYNISLEGIELHPFYESIKNLRDNKNGSNITFSAPAADADLRTRHTYRAAAASIYLAPSRAQVLAPKQPVQKSSVMGIYSLKEDKYQVKAGDVYKYGTAFLFDALRITDDAWRLVYSAYDI